MRRDLTIDNLGDLDRGIVRAVVNAAIADAVRDLEDRGEEDGKTRSVTIKLDLKKENGLITSQVHCEAKVPPRCSNKTVHDLKLNQGRPILYFEDIATDNPHQDTFREMDGGK